MTRAQISTKRLLQELAKKQSTDLHQPICKKTSILTTYERRLNTSTFTNNLVSDRIYFRVSNKSSEKFQFNFSFQQDFQFLDYSGPNLLEDRTRREDFISQTGASIQYDWKDWWFYRLQYFYVYRNTPGIDTLTNESIASFSKHLISLGMEVNF